jgi:hypothetical protein
MPGNDFLIPLILGCLPPPVKNRTRLPSRFFGFKETSRRIIAYAGRKVHCGGGFWANVVSRRLPTEVVQNAREMINDGKFTILTAPLQSSSFSQKSIQSNPAGRKACPEAFVLTPKRKKQSGI